MKSRVCKVLPNLTLHVKMSEGFSEDIFTVFEETPSSDMAIEKKGSEGPSATENAEDTPKFGEKRRFKPDVLIFFIRILQSPGTK